MDIVERLRDRAAQLSEAERPLSDATIAADEIERLRAKVREMGECCSNQEARIQCRCEHS